MHLSWLSDINTSSTNRGKVSFKLTDLVFHIFARLNFDLVWQNICWNITKTFHHIIKRPFKMVFSLFGFSFSSHFHIMLGFCFQWKPELKAVLFTVVLFYCMSLNHSMSMRDWEKWGKEWLIILRFILFMHSTFFFCFGSKIWPGLRLELSIYHKNFISTFWKIYMLLISASYICCINFHCICITEEDRYLVCFLK